MGLGAGEDSGLGLESCVRLDLFSAVLLTGSTLIAGGAEFGAQVGMVTAQGDTNSRMQADPGFNLAAWTAFTPGEGSRLRLRVDFTDVPGHSRITSIPFAAGSGASLVDTGTTRSVRTWSAGVDADWFPGGEAHRGAYLVAGLGLARTELSSGQGGSASALLGALGAGFQSQGRLGFELRYASTRPSLGGETFRNEAFVLALTTRF